MPILIVNQNKKTVKIFSLDKNNVTTIGAGSGHDIVLSGIPSLSLIKEKNNFHLMSLSANAKDHAPKLTKIDKQSYCFEQSNTQFFILTEALLDQEMTTLHDWNFGNFPKDPTALDYPEKILNFILDTFNQTQGALFYLEDNHLHTLFSKDLNMSSDGAKYLIHLLQEKKETSTQKINFQTHSLFFSNETLPMQHILSRAKCLSAGEVILYIPYDEKDQKIPEGMLFTLLHLVASNISTYLIQRFNKKLSIHYEREINGLYWGKNPQMKRLKAVVDKIAPTDLSVLITGETGSGKEEIAKYIANFGKKSKLTIINCGSIPESSAESYLFGHVKGAFAGASQSQKGKIQEAANGILLLDEVANLNLNIQAKLLRVLQDNLVAPVGGQEEEIKIRIIATTHADLIELIKEMKFREDLFFRLSEASIVVPALRTRPEDIMPLAKMFLDEVNAKGDENDKKFAPEVQKLLEQYSFPGNIRELKTLIKRISILSLNNVIDVQDFSDFLTTNEDEQMISDLNFARAKSIFIKNHISQVLRIAEGNKTKAAELMGMTPRSLFRILSNDEHDNNVMGNE